MTHMIQATVDAASMRDVWRSSDGRYRIAAIDWGRGHAPSYLPQVWAGGRWTPAGLCSLGEIVERLARQVDRDAGEEQAG